MGIILLVVAVYFVYICGVMFDYLCFVWINVWWNVVRESVISFSSKASKDLYAYFELNLSLPSKRHDISYRFKYVTLTKSDVADCIG